MSAGGPIDRLMIATVISYANNYFLINLADWAGQLKRSGKLDYIWSVRSGKVNCKRL